MKNKHILSLLVLLVGMVPVAVHANDLITVSKDIIDQIGGIVKLLLPIVFSLAILAFFWGIFLYIFSQSAEKKRDGKGILLWSVIAIFIMASIFGIVRVLQVTFKVTPPQGSGNSFTPPTVNQ